MKEKLRDLDNRHRSSNQSLIIVPEVENDEYLMKSDTGVCMYLYIQTHTHTHVWSFKPSYNNSVGKRKTCTHTKEFTTYSLRKEKITAINMYIYIINYK